MSGIGDGRASTFRAAPQDWRRRRPAAPPGPRPPADRGRPAHRHRRAAAPGDRLGSKEELRARCEVSVGTFNEAIRSPSPRDHLGPPGPGGGVFAAAQSPWSASATPCSPSTPSHPVAEAVRIRDALDPLLIEDALWHASPADIAELRESSPTCLGGAAAGSHRLRARQLVAARTYRRGQPARVLRSLYVSLLDQIESHTLAVLPGGEPSRCRSTSRPRHALHVAVVDALEQRDHDKALSLIAQHNTSNVLPARWSRPGPA